VSVTVSDLLRLPCLRDASLIGGKSGAGRTVGAVSVLEYTEASENQNYYLNMMDYVSDELVITCFASIRDDVQAQCITLLRLAEIGEVGLILFYVGSIVPQVDARLIEDADSLGFPLIRMPNLKPFPRYSEVIGEVMDAILKDRMTETNFQTEILDRVSKLPIYQRSIGTVLYMLSDRVKVSLLLTDAAGNLLNSVYWPRSMAFDAERFITGYNLSRSSFIPEQQLFVRYDVIDTAKGSRLNLFVLKHDEAIRESDAVQIIDVIRICLNLLSQNYADHVLPELVQAILNDEPFKMRRIAAIYHIDIQSIHNMWVITLGLGSNAELGLSGGSKALTLIRNELSPYCKTIVADIYNQGQDVVAFMDNPIECDMLPLADELVASLEASGVRALITVCLNLDDTTQARRVYLQNQNALTAARCIYPLKKVFTRHEIDFADFCRGLIGRGEEDVKNNMAVLDALTSGDARSRCDLAETLAVFLLDADSGMGTCARLTRVHLNTVKYRLNQISERLSFRIGHLPETISLYTAVALRRILRGTVQSED